MVRYCTLILLLSFTDANSQHILWQNTIGGNNADNLYSISPTIDGGVICGGYSLSNISGDKSENGRGQQDLWIVNLDSAGQILWQKTFGGSNEDVLKSVVQTGDGGYLCGGWSYSDSSGDKTTTSKGVSDYWILKLDSSGNVQWQNSFGGSNNDYLFALTQSSDGGYFLGGYSFSNASGDKTENSRGFNDYWIIKTDNFGNLQWDKTIGGNNEDRIFSLIPTPDSGSVCAGFSYSGISGEKTEANVGNADFWVLKLDKTGSIQWQNTFGGNDADYLYSASATPDGGLICGGWSNSNTSGDKTHDCFGFGGYGDYWVVKLDSAGNVQWDKTLGGSPNDELTSIIATGDSGYVCGGYSWSDTSGNKTKNNKGIMDYWVIYLDTAGQIKWQYDIGGINEDMLYSLYQDQDGGIVCGGSSNSGISGDKTENCQGNMDFWVLKFDRSFNTGIPEFQKNVFSLEVFPNPILSTAEVYYHLPHTASQAKLQLFNFTGQLIKEIVPNESTGKLWIDKENLPAGIYLLSLSDHINHTSVKIVIY